MKILLSILFLLLTVQPYEQYWASWFALAPLLSYTLRNPSALSNAGIGFAVGMIYYGATLHWILFYDAGIFFRVVPLAALPWGIFLMAVGLGAHRLRFPFKIMLPAFVWILLGVPLGFLPIGTLSLEIPFYQPLPFLQMASWSGMNPLILLILLWNAALALLWVRRTWVSVGAAIFIGMLVIASWFWGVKRLEKPSQGSMPVALIQTNFPISMDWRKKNVKFILKKYEAWARQAATLKPDIILFPQYALPFDAYRQPEFFNRLARETGAFLILGTYTPRQAGIPVETGGQYDIALVFSPTEGLIGEYRATQGPPFRRIGQVFQNQYPLIQTPAGPVGILLCYEDVMPSVSKRWMARGARYLVSLANTGHFAGTVLPRYHLLQDQLRAIETGLEVIRITPNGYSAVIDSRGRLRSVSKLNQEQILISSINPKPALAE